MTAYVGNLNFSRAIPAGSVIEVDARIIHRERTSMQVLVRVESSIADSPGLARAMDCIPVFVAVNTEGRPTSVPLWQPASALEEQLQDNARAGGSVREQIHVAMRAQEYSDEGRLLASRSDFSRFRRPPTLPATHTEALSCAGSMKQPVRALRNGARPPRMPPTPVASTSTIPFASVTWWKSTQGALELTRGPATRSARSAPDPTQGAAS